jgi:CRISPR-associated protein Cas5h
VNILKFNVSGKTAHFKKPDVNSYAYYTYSHIHKISIYGILGAILGLNGYAQQKEEQYPEFYERLKNIKIGIVPKGEKRGYFSKKIIEFNNSVGYANIDAKSNPCNLVVREQWLEDVSWDIYVSLDDFKDELLKDKLVDYILHMKAEYIPYLGKNDHMANICDGQILNYNEIKDVEEIHSLFYYDKTKLEYEAVDEDETPFLFKDYMPVELNPINNKYEFRELGFSNRAVEYMDNQTIIVDKNKNIVLI